MPSQVKKRNAKRATAKPSKKITLAGLSERWEVSKRTIMRRVEDGTVPKPIMLGGLCWFEAVIEEFEKTPIH